MVEMTETAAILHNATPRSLILLDEIGRGTSTFDGLSIAWAVAEYLHNSPEHSAKTMFATHYHELTELAENLPGAKNYQLTATESDGEVVFLHKLQKGKASKSYGIAVARSPDYRRMSSSARRMFCLDSKDTSLRSSLMRRRQASGPRPLRKRPLKFRCSRSQMRTRSMSLRTTDIEGLSPEESKTLLGEIKRKIV